MAAGRLHCSMEIFTGLAGRGKRAIGPNFHHLALTAILANQRMKRHPGFTASAHTQSASLPRPKIPCMGHHPLTLEPGNQNVILCDFLK
ncbi:unnamed protein product [Lupinus luteus]|uniref:Uncharacterized protein n=1 Tax=Lupinus luteus TaxID=3873 RepID=A0AAV1XV58_LUPLU